MSVFDAASFALEARFTIPSCVQNDCASPNDVNEILVDPSHGDAYLVITVGLFSLNLSTLSLVGTTFDYGNGPEASSTYDPITDQIFSTYAIYQLGPGLLVQLHHGTVPVLTSLLWLPPVLGELTVFQLTVGGIVALAVWVRNRRRRSGSA